MNILLRDISEQPHTVSNLLRHCSSNYEKLEHAARLLDKGDIVVLTGMGASLVAAEYGARLLRSQGRKAIALPTDELYQSSNEYLENAILIGISQSGMSAEIVELFKRKLKLMGRIALTNNIQSNLAVNSDFVFELLVQRQCPAATKTLMASMLLLELLTNPSQHRMFCKLPDMLSWGLSVDIPDKWVQLIADQETIDLIGANDDQYTAALGALMFREVCRIRSMSYSLHNFRHGIIESVRKGYMAIVLESGDRASTKLSEQIKAYNGNVMLLPWMPLPKDYPKAYKKYHNILLIQRLAYEVAVSRNINPGQLRMGSVVNTLF